MPASKRKASPAASTNSSAKKSKTTTSTSKAKKASAKTETPKEQEPPTTAKQFAEVLRSKVENDVKKSHKVDSHCNQLSNGMVCACS